jgi:hypothetical protein
MKKTSLTALADPHTLGDAFSGPPWEGAGTAFLAATASR